MNSIIRNLDLHAQGNWLPIMLSVLLFLYALFMPKKEIGYEKSHGWSFFISIPLYFVVFSFFLPLHSKFMNANDFRFRMLRQLKWLLDGFAFHQKQGY